MKGAFRTIGPSSQRHEIGTICYRLSGWDHGCAYSDSLQSGIAYVSMTLDPNGDYPGFSIPLQNLEPADDLAHRQTYLEAVGGRLGATRHPGDWQQYFEKPYKYLNNRFEYFYGYLDSRGLIERHPDRPELFKVRPLPPEH
jgi:hypothetical protein